MAEQSPVGEVVYFMRAPSNGRLKIGYTADLTTRATLLRSATGEALELIGAIPGDRDVEAGFHAEFSDHRIVGEWFHPAGELLGRIESFRPQFIPEEAFATRAEAQIRRQESRAPAIGHAGVRLAALLREIAPSARPIAWTAETIGADARTARNWLDGQIPNGGGFVQLGQFFGEAFILFVLFGPDLGEDEALDRIHVQIAAMKVRAFLMSRDFAEHCEREAKEALDV